MVDSISDEPTRGQIWLIGGIKGGTGKTTLALSLGSLVRRDGYDLLMVDADRQQTLTKWAGLRGELGVKPPLTVVTKRGARIAADILALAAKYDLVIVDCGGADAAELRSALIAADRLFTPLVASQPDAWSLGELAAVIEDANSVRPEPIIGEVVVARASTNPIHDELGEIKETLSDLVCFRVMRSVVRERIAHRKAVMVGRSVIEMDKRDSRATSEILALYREIMATVGELEETDGEQAETP
jgi:chromosome partitioning protein